MSVLAVLLAAAGLVSPPVTSLSFISTRTGTLAAAGIPTSASGARAGDICFMAYSAGNAASATAPTVSVSGWTQILSFPSFNTASADSERMWFGYKILQTPDLGASFTPTNGVGANFFGWVTAVFRPDHTVNTLTASSINTSGSTGTAVAPAAQTVTSSAQPVTSVVFALFGIGGGGTNTPKTMTPSDATLAGATQATMAYKIFNSSPSDVAVSGTWTGGTTRELASCCVSIG